MLDHYTPSIHSRHEIGRNCRVTFNSIRHMENGRKIANYADGMTSQCAEKFISFHITMAQYNNKTHLIPLPRPVASSLAFAFEAFLLFRIQCKPRRRRRRRLLRRRRWYKWSYENEVKQYHLRNVMLPRAQAIFRVADESGFWQGT